MAQLQTDGASLLLFGKQAVVGKVQGRAQRMQRAAADRRLRLLRETVLGVRAVKFGAWEERAEARIQQVRSR